MNTIFVDMNNFNLLKDHQKPIKEKLKWFWCYLKGFILEQDIFNHTRNAFYYLNLDKQFVTSLKKRKRCLIKKLMLEKYCKHQFKKLDHLHLLFSNQIEEHSDLYKYLIDFFRHLHPEIKISEIESSNHLLENDVGYIENYVKENHLKYNRLKILVTINDLADYHHEKVIEYINKYKFLDILRMPDIHQYDYKKLQNLVTSINNEYGTTIELIQKRNIQEYDIYLSYSDISYSQFLSRYIVNTKAKYINMKDPDEDSFNENIKSYEKNKETIAAIFNRLAIDSHHFMKNKLGNLFLKLDK